jgi:hypothetical protein
VNEFIKSTTALVINALLRLQVHSEDASHVRYKLMGYGIPVECAFVIIVLFLAYVCVELYYFIHSHPIQYIISVLPVTDSGNVKLKNFHVWMKGRFSIERLEEEKRKRNDHTPHGLVDCPSSFDVVFKSGTTNQSHPGNVHYRDLLETIYDAYSNAGESRQAVVTATIQAVKEKNGRFLEWSREASCWKVMDDDGQIRNKIYSSLFYMIKQNHAKNAKVNVSSTNLFETQEARKRKWTNDGKEPKCWSEGCR